MPVVCLGIAHHSAPLAVREQFAFSAAARRELLAALAERVAPLGITELALLATCNRTELYAAHGEVGHRFRSLPAALPRLLAEHHGLAIGLLQRHAYGRVDLDAVRHLARVAAGLESMVLGESEILGQVGDAQRAADQARTLGPVLRSAFDTAVRAGRRARAETGIARSSVSVASEAVRMVRTAGVDLAHASVLLVGTGKVGRLAAQALRGQGVRSLAVVSRTAATADELARRHGARALPWHELAAALRAADVVFTGTGAPHAVLTVELVRTALAGRAAGRPLLLVDLAVPRDVEPAVRGLPGVAVRDLDDVQERVAVNIDERRREVPAVEAIVADELSRFEDWCSGVALRPVLAALAAYGEAERRRAVERVLARHGHGATIPREALEAATRQLVARLLHAPLTHLREEADPIRREQQAELVREMFGLPGGALAEAEAS